MATRNARTDPTFSNPDRRPPDGSEENPTAFDSADPPRNFTLDVNERVRALTIGAPAFATRKKRLEDFEENTIRLLVVLHDKLRAQGKSREDIEDSLHDRAGTIELRKVNELVEHHNRYYPIEANLPTDLRTGQYLIYGRPWEPEAPFTATRLVTMALSVIAQRPR